jgi:hypothetical protein
MAKVIYQAASRPRGDEHMPVIIKVSDCEIESITILANVPQTTRKMAKAYAKAYIDKKIFKAL